jgi:hypothetical protein
VAWFPLLSITSLPARSYNEGWNAYRQWMTVAGVPLYGAPSGLWTTNYPFLSFHLIGLIGGARDKMVLAGRAVCFASLVVAALLAGGIVRKIAGGWAGAVYAALLLFAGLGAFYGTGRAVDDPEMLGVAFAMLGLFAYLRAARLSAVAFAAAAFALSLFTKQDLLVFPLSVALHLLMTRNWRGFAVFAGAGVVVAGGLLALSYHLDGVYFLADLFRPRAYALRNLSTETLHYLLHFAVPLVIAVAVLRRAEGLPYRGLLIILLLCSNAVAVCFSGGDGVASNIFYPALIADVLACVCGLCWLEREGRYFAAALVVTTLAVALIVPFQLYADVRAQQLLPAATVQVLQAVALLRDAQGPAICEDLLICYESGKPMDYDPYYVGDQILIGRIREDDVLAMLATQHYAVIQTAGRPEGRFTPAVVRMMLARYRQVMGGADYSVFVPRA